MFDFDDFSVVLFYQYKAGLIYDQFE